MTPAGTHAAASTDEARREQFREQHQVRLVENAHEGFGVDQLPNGTYGFTYSPAAEAPMFGSRKYQNFEIHKASSGGKFILGYLTPAEASDIAKKKARDLRLYPDIFEQATELVCLSLGEVYRRAQHSGEKGSPAPLRYEP